MTCPVDAVNQFALAVDEDLRPVIGEDAGNLIVKHENLTVKKFFSSITIRRRIVNGIDD